MQRHAHAAARAPVPPEPGAGDADDEPVIKAFIHDRFVDMFLSQNHRAQLGLLVAAALLAFIWYSRTRAVEVALWMTGVVSVMLLRYAFSDRFIRYSPEGADTRIMLVLVLNGILLAMPLAAFGQFSDIERAAVSIVLLGSATASVATTSGYRFVFLAFATPMLVPLAISWAIWASVGASAESRGAAWGLAGLILLFLLFLLGVAQQANRVFDDSGRFRYGEQQLNRKLTRAVELAREANRAKTHFLAAASHDLRQPIHSMNVLVAALGLRPLDSQSREMVDLLEAVNEALSRQLDGLLDISKLDAGIVQPVLGVHRLDAIVTAHYSAVMPRAVERGLDLRLTTTDDLHVHTDPTLLHRILSNLTDNALKFTPRGGAIAMGLMRHGSDAVIEVIDTGIGIPAEEQQKVFHEFYQVGNTGRDRSRGLGLGLSIVRRLCDLLGVEVSLVSQPGQGTTVRLRLPVVAAVGADAPVQLDASVQRGLRVLVVDDELVVRESMRMLLRELGCIVHVAEGTDSAVDIACSHAVDVVLSDHRLSDGDSGLRVIRELTQIQPGIRAALITGDTAPDRIAEARSAGVPLLHKPVSLSMLTSVLRESGRGGGEDLREERR